MNSSDILFLQELGDLLDKHKRTIKFQTCRECDGSLEIGSRESLVPDIELYFKDGLFMETATPRRLRNFIYMSKFGDFTETRSLLLKPKVITEWPKELFKLRESRYGALSAFEDFVKWKHQSDLRSGLPGKLPSFRGPSSIIDARMKNRAAEQLRKSNENE